MLKDPIIIFEKNLKNPVKSHEGSSSIMKMKRVKPLYSKDVTRLLQPGLPERGFTIDFLPDNML